MSAAPATPVRRPFEYAVVRVVPRVERGEAMNAGVLLYCRELDYLGCAVQLDVDRLSSLDAGADVPGVRAALESIIATCRATGPAGGEDIGRRFRWLTAARSTVVQPGPVHTGLTDDPAAELQRLLRVLVLPVSGTNDAAQTG